MISSHSEHCHDCKQRVRQFLIAIYGDCLIDHAFPWPAKPEEYERTVIRDALQQIVAGLQRLRGFRDFIKSTHVPPCDFYVPNPPFILEFDESQHFTQARHVTLSHYPPPFKVGFPMTHWLELCRMIDAKDNDPPDRDERRAWYDTLRDLVPAVHGLEPTVRVYSNEFRWCLLDSESKTDRETFCAVLKGRLPIMGEQL